MGGVAGGVGIDPRSLRRLEDRLIEAAQRYAVADLRDGERGELPAVVIHRLCTERLTEVGSFGVRVARARVTGSLDLRAVDLPFGLEFKDCLFDEAPIVEGARLHELAIVSGSKLPGLLANGVTIRRDLDLSGAHVLGALETTASTSKTSAVWLTEADIGGRLLCVGTEIKGADRALQADRTHFGGNIRMIHGFTTDGEIRLIAIRLDGSLDLTGACLEPENGRAVDLGEAQVGGSVFIIEDDARGGARPVVRGRIEMGHASVEGRILIRNASLTAPDPGKGGHHYLPSGAMHRCALSAPRLSVVGDVLFDGSCRVEGGIDLQNAEIRGDVRLDGQIVENPGDHSLDLTAASVGGTISGRGLQSCGKVTFAGARVTGSVRLADAHLTLTLGDRDRSAGRAAASRCSLDSERPAVLVGAGAAVAGDVELCGSFMEGGEVLLPSITVRGHVEAHHATLRNHGTDAFVLDYALVDGDVRLADGFDVDGTVSLVGLTTKGILDLTDATVTNAPSQPAIAAVNARAEGAMFLRWRRVAPRVNFDGASTPALWDDPDNWPEQMSIAGFQYGRFWRESAPSLWDAKKRIAWLARQQPLDAAPYEQLAQVLRTRGQPQQAETIQVAYLRRERLGLSRRRRMTSIAWDRLTLYGFQPWRVIALMGLLVVGLAALLMISAPGDAMRAVGASGTLFRPDGPVSSTAGEHGPCGDGDVRCFRPALYAIDVVVPLVDLGQRDTWRPEPHAPWGSLIESVVAVCTVLGWTLSTIFALSFTRLARSR